MSFGSLAKFTGTVTGTYLNDRDNQLVTVFDEGTLVGAEPKWDFQGAGVTASVAGNLGTITLPSASIFVTTEDEGVVTGAPAGVDTLNFVGAQVTVSVVGDVATIDHPAPDVITVKQGGVTVVAAADTVNLVALNGINASVPVAGTTQYTFFDPAPIVYMGTGTATNNGGAGTITIGNGAVTTGGTDAIAVGRDATSIAVNSIAMGYNSQASADNTIALGPYALASADSAIAVGHNAGATGAFGVACGKNSSVSGSYGVALGYTAEAASHCVSIGSAASDNGTGDGALAIGSESVSDSLESIAYGWQAEALADYAVAVGSNSLVDADSPNGVALGHLASCVASPYGLAIGSGATSTPLAGAASPFALAIPADSVVAPVSVGDVAHLLFMFKEGNAAAARFAINLRQ